MSKFVASFWQACDNIVFQHAVLNKCTSGKQQACTRSIASLYPACTGNSKLAAVDSKLAVYYGIYSTSLRLYTCMLAAYSTWKLNHACIPAWVIMHACLLNINTQHYYTNHKVTFNSITGNVHTQRRIAHKHISPGT